MPKDRSQRRSTASSDLHLSVAFGEVKKVKSLLAEYPGSARAADPKMDGATPLHRAAWAGNVEVARLLIAHGARVSDSDKYGDRPLHGACSWGRASMVKYLIRLGAKVNAQDTLGGYTPLHWAAQYGHVEVVRILIAAGADPRRRNKHGRTPEEWASRYGHTRTAAYLRRVTSR
jgi:ankyrin repeat protein